MDNLNLPPEEENFDIREVLGKFAYYWYWFLLSIGICIAVAYWINYTTIPVYEVKSSILVEEGKSMLDDSRFAVPLFQNNSFQVGNQISIIKSLALTRRAIQRLNFRISYFQQNRLRTTELYKDSPFVIITDSTSVIPVNVPIYVDVEAPTRVRIHAEAGSESFDFKKQKICKNIQGSSYEFSGDILHPVRYKHLNISIAPVSQKDFSSYTGKRFYFIVNDDLSLVSRFQELTVQDSKTSSTISVSIRGNNISKLVDFLNTLSEVYLEKGLEKKNRIAENTIRFINSQLGDVADSLFFSEKNLQDFRKAHNVMDVDFQAQQVFTSIENLKNQRAELVVKSKYYDYIYQYLNESKDGKDLIAPSSLGIQDMVLDNLINELINLYNERSELSVNSIRNNPYISSNDLRIKNLQQSVLQNIVNLSKAVKISIQDIDKRIDEISLKGNKLPETQRNLVGIERKFKMNDALYTYLLTKRSEMQIAKASYLPDNEVIDEASPDTYTLISPQGRRNLLIALILGLGFPAVIILLRDYFNTSIENDEDVKNLCDVPVLGHIVRSRENSETVIADSPLSITSESVRAIRTNFQFLNNGRIQHTILVTSSIQGEGKSFSTLNIALSFALFKKKTILLNFDLRKPKLQEYLNISVDKGLSSYLSGNASLKDVIVKTQHECLDVIFAGAIPPNPMELIGSTYTKELFKDLKKLYEYIIIDSPPVGVVADCLLLVEFSDINLFIVRQRYTPKKVFSKSIENLNKREIRNLHVIINDVTMSSRYAPYNNGYAYGYGYGYKEEKSAKKKRFGFLK